MDNLFRHINHPPLEVPPELKSKVMSDIAMAKLIMELSGLFTYNMGDIIKTVIKSRKNNIKN